MNKGKKRLSKLLIPMLALSGVAMNNTEAGKRGVSIRKVKNNILNSLRLKDYHSFELKGKDRVVVHFDKAYEELIEKYELLDSFKSIKYRYNLNTKKFYEVGSGKDGIVSLCRRKSDRKIFVVKYRPRDNVGYSPSDEFYEDSKVSRKNWKSKEWAVLKRDKYVGPNGSLTVTDYVDGMTLKEYIRKLKKEIFTVKIKKLLEIMKKFEKIICDLAKQGCVINDLNPENIMLINNPENKNEIILKVVDYDDYDNNVSYDQSMKSGYSFLNMLFLEAAEQLFNYKELRTDYTKLRDKGMSHFEIWYPPYKNSKSKEMMNALLFLELARVSDYLGVEPHDDKGNLVYIPRQEPVHNCMNCVVDHLTNVLPRLLEDRQNNNYIPYSENN